MIEIQPLCLSDVALNQKCCQFFSMSSVFSRFLQHPVQVSSGGQQDLTNCLQVRAEISFLQKRNTKFLDDNKVRVLLKGAGTTWTESAVESSACVR